ncbi:MAG: hypothetical protein KH366_17665 [Clostridiaceae bacterium]|nr:hypothetical protein [Clostridiaceae bacterium]
MRDSLLKKVLDSARLGELDGFEKFYILTYKDAYRHAASFIKEPNDVWKILCNVYVKLYEDREKLPGPNEIQKKIFELIDDISASLLDEEGIYSGNELENCDISEEKAATVLSIIEEKAGISEKESENLKTRDYIFIGFRAVIALAVVGLAVFIVLSGTRRVQSYNSKIKTILADTVIGTLADTTQVSVDQETVTETEVDIEPGLNEFPEGMKYLNEDNTYLKDSWKEVEGNLYYFNGDGYAVIGNMVVDDQVFVFGDDCALTIIERAGSDKISTANSIQAVGDVIYYLKEVLEKENSNDETYDLYRISEEKRKEGKKELIISNIQDYFILDDMVYYMQDDILHKCTILNEGYAVEDIKTEVLNKGDAFYLVNELEEPVSSENGIVEIENRLYRVDNGKIKYVKPGEMRTQGVTYYFNGSTPQTSRGIYWKYASGEGSILVEEGYWIDSFCIVGDWIYYSAYVGKADGYNRYSQLYRISVDGTKKEVLSEVFKGNMMNMYYYSDKQEIYGEYRPNTDNNYGRLAAISLTGNIELINDSAVRVGKDTTGEDTLELIMVSGDKISCYWHDCDWYADGGVNILWTVPIELSDKERVPLQ